MEDLRTGASDSLQAEGQEHGAYGEAVTDEAEIAQVLRIFTRTFPGYAGTDTDSEGRATSATLAKAAREQVVTRARVNPEYRKEMTNEHTESH